MTSRAQELAQAYMKFIEYDDKFKFKIPDRPMRTVDQQLAKIEREKGEFLVAEQTESAMRQAEEYVDWFLTTVTMGPVWAREEDLLFQEFKEIMHKAFEKVDAKLTKRWL